MSLDFISIPLGGFLHFIYNNLAFLNYGLAIVVFTFFIRMVLLPLTVKQYTSMARMQEIQPLIQDLQKKYKNDKEKLNQELMKVYQDNKVNPAGGCLPLLIQMPVLFSLYYVISSPLKYMKGIKPEVIDKLFEIIKSTDTTFAIANLKDISVINFFTKYPEKLADVSNLLKNSDILNMNFLGLNLGLVPTWRPDQLFGNVLSVQYLFLLLVPALVYITTYASIKYSTSTQKTDGNEMAASMNKSMSLMMPIMTTMFAFSVPAGLGFYWIVNNLFQILQQLYMNKYVIKKKEEVSK